MLHVKTTVLRIIIDFYHTNITLAVLIGQLETQFHLKTQYVRRCYCDRNMQYETQC